MNEEEFDMDVGGYPRVVYTGRQSLWFAGLGACVSLVLFVGTDTHVVSSLRTGREDEDVWCRSAQREEEEAKLPRMPTTSDLLSSAKIFPDSTVLH